MDFMAIRQAIQDIIDAGPLPTWREPDGSARISAIAELIERAPTPVTDEEAQALTVCFGPDDALGAAWALLHLIETAPSAVTATYGENGTADNEWVQKLNERVAYAAEEAEETE
jgi:hypothetical protein